jgi:hypothetical protein
MSNPSPRRLSKIVHIASPAEAIILGPGVPFQLVPLSPRLSSILTSTMMTLVERGEWIQRVYHDSPNIYVYERR